MKYYFDNRMNDGTPLTIYIENELYDKLYLKKDAINLIELPNNCKEVRFSFYGSYSTPERVNRKIVNDLPSELSERSTDKNIRYMDKQIRFLYDTVINVEKYKEDLILYPTPLNLIGLKNIWYFKAVQVSEGKNIGVRLVKNKKINLQKYIKNSVKTILAGMVGDVFLIVYSLHMILTSSEFSLNWLKFKYRHLGMIGIVLFSIVLFILIFALIQTLVYKNKCNERLLKNEYYMSEDEEV